jgi:hypothetical protein
MTAALRRAGPPLSVVGIEPALVDDIQARYGWGTYWADRGRETLITDQAGAVIVRVISLGPGRGEGDRLHRRKT